mgnify:FL=1
MSTLLIQLYIALALHGGESMDGYAPRYAKGVMERVVKNRDLPYAACNVSSAYYGIGTEVWVVSWTTYQVRRCRVADVSHPRDVARHRRTKRIIESSFVDAKWICGLEHMHDRPERCPVTVLRIEGEP